MIGYTNVRMIFPGIVGVEGDIVPLNAVIKQYTQTDLPFLRCQQEQWQSCALAKALQLRIE